MIEVVIGITLSLLGFLIGGTFVKNTLKKKDLKPLRIYKCPLCHHKTPFRTDNTALFRKHLHDVHVRDYGMMLLHTNVFRMLQDIAGQELLEVSNKWRF